MKTAINGWLVWSANLNFTRIYSSMKWSAEAHARMASIIESAADAIVGEDLGGLITDWNPAAERVFGYTADEMIGAPLLRLTPTDRSAEELQIRERIRLGENVMHLDTVRRLKNGALLDVSITAAPIKDATGKIIGVSKTLRDITQQKRTEQKLRESEEKFARLFHASPIAMTLSTMPEGRHLDVNDEFLRLVQRPREEVIGRTAVELGVWLHAEQRAKCLEQIKAQGFLGNFEMEIPVAGGRRRQILWSAVAVEISGESFLLGSMVDITERKVAEIRFQHSERALQTVSACDQVLVHADTEAALLSQICQVVVEHGGYRMAWVGFADHDEAKTVRVAAVAGHEEGYLAQGEISWSETSDRGRGPTGTAIRTGRTFICQNIQTDPCHVPWREAAAHRGYAASISLPLRGRDHTFGVLMIYAAEINAFQPVEVDLLTTMSEDLAYGLDSLRTRQKHRQAEQALRMTQFSVEQSGDAISWLRPDGSLVQVNETMSRVFGYSRQELLTMRAHDLNPAHPPAVWAEHWQELRRKQRMTFEAEFRAKDGRMIPVEVLANYIEFEGQEFNCAFIRDISARKRAEEQMRLQVSALDAAANAIVITNREGNIEWVNPAFTQLTGYSAREAIGQNPRVLKSGQHPPGFYANLWATVSTGKVWHGEMINKRKDGRLYTEEMTVTPVRGQDGVITHFVAVKQDVTERRLLEDHLRHGQKMEAIGTLAGGIAHDFNNILGAMSGFGYLLQQDTEGNSAAQESVVEILAAVHRAKDLVQQILTFSRQREQVRRVIQLDTVVKETMRFLRASLPAQIQIDLQLAPDAPPILADPTQIYQVVLNLATNALHAMEEHGGQLGLSLAPFFPDEQFLAGHPEFLDICYARLMVADTGHGMDAQTLGRIFEPFFTTKPVGKGTGLGLAVVHGIVKSHEGLLTVESQVGCGTTFCLYFPGQSAATDLPETAAVRIQPGRGESILLVDDEQVLTTVLQRALSRLGYEVATSNHPAEALRWVSEHPGRFGLVVTDLTMPDMNGLELAGKLQLVCPDLPVILMSGYSGAITVDRLREAGVRELLDKPVSPHTLAEVVQRVLAQA